MLSAYSKGRVKGTGFSAAKDTRILKDLLSNPQRQVFDAGDAGTTFRFLCTYLALKGQPVILTGSQRMKERPIGPLVNALQLLGCSIEYMEKEGYPPLSIGPFRARNYPVSIQGDVSSQFISSLMMAAPTLPYGLDLSITGTTASFPYLRLTWNLMQLAGIQGIFRPDRIQISPQTYQPLDYQIEPDWSAAGYFYAWLVAEPMHKHFLFPGLRLASDQGDSVLARLMEKFGIISNQTAEGVEIRKTASREMPAKMELNMDEFPDQAQTLICLCAFLGVEAHFEGLKSLAIKETNRLLALQTELRKVGVEMEIFEKEGKCQLPGNQKIQIPENLVFATYGDHRMAMALQLFALKGRIQFDNPEVVEKSFPGFWNEMAKV